MAKCTAKRAQQYLEQEVYFSQIAFVLLFRYYNISSASFQHDCFSNPKQKNKANYSAAVYELA